MLVSCILYLCISDQIPISPCTLYGVRVKSENRESERYNVKPYLYKLQKVKIALAKLATFPLRLRLDLLRYAPYIQ